MLIYKPPVGGCNFSKLVFRLTTPLFFQARLVAAPRVPMDRVNACFSRSSPTDALGTSTASQSASNEPSALLTAHHQLCSLAEKTICIKISHVDDSYRKRGETRLVDSMSSSRNRNQHRERSRIVSAPTWSRGGLDSRSESATVVITFKFADRHFRKHTAQTARFGCETNLRQQSLPSWACSSSSRARSLELSRSSQQLKSAFSSLDSDSDRHLVRHQLLRGCRGIKNESSN